MKKLLLVGLVFGALSLTSCKKSYTCEYPDGSTSTMKYDKIGKTQASLQKTNCEVGGGTWSKK